MPTPELPRDDLVKMMRAMQRDLDTLKQRSPFANTGFIHTGPTSLQLQRTDGTPALVFTDGPTTAGVQRISLEDSFGKDLIREDEAGSGLAWPLMPVVFAGVSWPTWDSNNSATFVSVAEASPNKCSPRARFNVEAICDGSATGEVKLTLWGADFGATYAVPNLGWTVVTIGPLDLPYGISDVLYFELRARVASGTGKCYARVVAANQLGSD